MILGILRPIAGESLIFFTAVIYPVVKVLPPKRPQLSAGRWARVEHTGQWTPARIPGHETTARGPACEPSDCRVVGPGRVVPGLKPGAIRYAVPGIPGPEEILRLIGDGGDEETRTPDPLLAKEMLFQLSYVPELLRVAMRGGWWAFLDSNQRPLPYQGSALTS